MDTLHVLHKEDFIKYTQPVMLHEQTKTFFGTVSHVTGGTMYHRQKNKKQSAVYVVLARSGVPQQLL